jgi:hypothetical protein
LYSERFYIVELKIFLMNNQMQVVLINLLHKINIDANNNLARMSKQLYSML